MWIVQVALRRPYTFIVMALMILLATPLALMRMPTDVFPDIDIPVVSIIWNYNGLPAQEMGSRIATVNERGLTTTVNDIEHIESQSVAGISIVKVFFQPGVDIQMAVAQIVSATQAQTRQMPPGITPPLVIKYSASSIPVIQLGLSSPTLPEQDLFDHAVNTLRPRLITIPGAAVPFPYGGKNRLVSVDLDTKALQAKGLTATDVVNAISAQNLILPSGTAKIGETEYSINTRGSPSTIAALNSLPIRTSSGATTYIRDVAFVHDGYTPQTNIVRQNGERGVLLSVYKNGSASTIEIVDRLKALLPQVSALIPKEITITPLFDQSIFVKAAIAGVMHEAVIAGCLTAAMILLFLGNWRSTCIIAISIPLSILSSVLALYALGETLNLMTLGGLALAVGILVDDATVTIENIERHLHLGKDLYTAVLDGAGEIAVPTFVSTLCICIVFVPMFFLTGVARYLFVPLAEAVVFAMLASYVLSRTLVPTLSLLLMRGAHRAPAADTGTTDTGTTDTGTANTGTADGRDGAACDASTSEARRPSLPRRLYLRFDAAFERLRGGYIIVLSSLLTHRKSFGAGFMAFCLASLLWIPALGEDFFPSVDAGQLKLHFRAPSGTRIEETARWADRIENRIRELIPADDLDSLIDNLGLPYSGINLSYSNAGTIGTLDGEIMISLKKGHRPSEHYQTLMRQELPRSFPGIEFFFQPADIVTQILNFGLPAAIDVQFAGADVVRNHELAARLAGRVRQIHGAVDVHVHQKLDLPALAVDIDRTRIQQIGLNAVNVAQSMLVSLSGSFQTSPAFWLNPANDVVYSIAVQTPQYQVDSLDALLNLPVNAAGQAAAAAAPPQLLGNLVQLSPERRQAVVSRYDIQPVVDVYAGVQGRDLGSVAAEVRRLVDEIRGELPRGTTVTIRGQVQTMQSSFSGLLLGLAMAIVLVYLLIVVNFQSWIDALVVIVALPAALAGIAWMLLLTGTTLSVPALTGAIMTMGVATANSILVISFARQRMADGVPPLSAALEAGATRLRPVLMTALAMIIGMVPMALGLGEGSEQNAPLGRAVIGGLLLATLSTLMFVPVVFAAVHRWLARRASRRATPSIAPPSTASTPSVTTPGP
ncbi:MAG: efflux RND transporter permease subunit [Burkholderiaceae bacterium]